MKKRNILILFCTAIICTALICLTLIFKKEIAKAYFLRLGTKPDSLVLFPNDTLGIHKAMFNQMLVTLDSMHAISKDPRADLIYRFIRPRLVLVGSTPSNPIAVDDPIYVIPLLESEQDISMAGYVDNGEVRDMACYGENLEYGIRKSLTVFNCNKYSFASLAMIINHEAEHAYRSANNEDDKEMDHPEIFIFECSLLATCMEHDKDLAQTYHSLLFDKTLECTIFPNSPYFKFSEEYKSYMVARFHGIWWINTYGAPKTDQEKVALYNALNHAHEVFIF